jgi:pantothenate kinase
MATFPSIESIVDELRRTAPTAGRRIIGIAGPPGAGKSTIAEQLVRSLDAAALLPMDGYHYPQAHLVALGRRERMGAPDTFDVDAFVATLARVRTGGTVLARGFDREIEQPVDAAITIAPSVRTVVVEGNYLLLDSGGWERVAPLIDVSLFVRVDDGIRQERLIARHERYGKSPDAARAWALGPDETNARLIAPTAARADHVIAPA